MTLLKINQLYAGYRSREVLKGINLELTAGKFVGIIGANGSGKTTLLKSISGYLKPFKGNVLINGEDIHKLSSTQRARRIGYLPQINSSGFAFKCYDIVMMGRFPYLKRFQREGKQDREIVKKTMVTTDTWCFRDRTITELSGGERQRVYIARLLAQKPEIILMDEPITYLDIKYQIEILELLRGLSKKGILVIVVLHDINLASQFCEEIIMLRNGRLVCRGKPENVLTAENTKKVFSVDVHVVDNPFTAKPYIVAKTKNDYG